jgi:hypothetical protein
MEADKHAIPPPQHPFDVRISIGANNWDYVLRAAVQVLEDLRRAGPDCNVCSGGWDGSFSITVHRRPISADEYREELRRWTEATR